MPRVFISYRREDSAAHAGRIYDRLVAEFGPAVPFMDVDNIPPGANFRSHVAAAIAHSDAMLVVIGRQWLSMRDDSGRLRLSDPDDPVATEVAIGLEQNVRIIPLLVGSAKMPQADDLPSGMRALASRNAVVLDDANFHRDADLLMQALKTIPSLSAMERDKLSARNQASTRWVRVALTIVILGLAGFGAWHWRQNQSEAKVIAQLAGQWAGQVAYSWGVTQHEHFDLKIDAPRVHGAATFLGVDRAIVDGKVNGKKVTFQLQWQEINGSQVRDVRAHYVGTLDGDQMHFIYRDDRGGEPSQFVVRKLKQGE